MNCKNCNSQNTVKFGTYTDSNGTDIQRYYCKDCKRKFVPNTLPKMQTPIHQVSAVLSMYYGGMSLDQIQRHLKQEFNNDVSESSILNWVIRFTKEAIEKTKDFRPKVGDTWIADETGIDIVGSPRDMWFWDIIDSDSRFLLASHISISRTTEDAQALIQKAIRKAGKKPKVIMTDKQKSYLDGIKYAAGNETVHLITQPFVSKDSTNIIERFQGTFKDRTKIVRGYKNMEHAKIITEGFLINYNYFKQHEGIGNVPPAVKMGLPMPFNNWLDVVKSTATPKPQASHIEETTSSFFDYSQLNPEQRAKHLHRLVARKAQRKYTAKKKASQTTPQITTIRNYQKRKQP